MRDGELRIVHHAVTDGVAGLAQVVEQHLGVPRPVGRLAGGGGQHQRVEVGRDGGAGLAPLGGGADRGQRDLVVHVAVGHLDRGVAGVRLASGEHLEQHHAERVHVAAGVGVAVGDQFGGDVGDGADQHAVGGRGVRGHGAGEAEVGDLDLATVGDQHVLGLEVAVDDAGLVGGCDGCDHRDQQVERPLRLHRGLAGDQVAQRRALDVLHDHVGPAVVVALVEDGDHVGVREAGGGAGFAVEAAGEVLVAAEVVVHHLHRDGAGEAAVGGEVDGGHAAAGELAEDLVPAVEQVPHEGVAVAHGRHVWLLTGSGK